MAIKGEPLLVRITAFLMTLDICLRFWNLMFRGVRSGYGTWKTYSDPRILRIYVVDGSKYSKEELDAYNDFFKKWVDATRETKANA